MYGGGRVPKWPAISDLDFQGDDFQSDDLDCLA
jgi:hypothetical protein